MQARLLVTPRGACTRPESRLGWMDPDGGSHPRITSWFPWTRTEHQPGWKSVHGWPLTTETLSPLTCELTCSRV